MCRVSDKCKGCKVCPKTRSKTLKKGRVVDVELYDLIGKTLEALKTIESKL